MQAYAEGYELLAAEGPRHRRARRRSRPGASGTVVRSWLLDLLVQALEEDPELAEIDDWVEDSGEGRWTVDEAIDLAVPAAGDLRGAVRPVRLAAGRLAGDEGRRRAAPAVRRARRARRLPEPGVEPAASRPDVRRAPLADRLPLLRAGRARRSTPGSRRWSGPNGQGKTNLVEAVGYVATLGCHRVAARRGAGASAVRAGRSCGRAWCASSTGQLDAPSRSRSRRARRTAPQVNGGSPVPRRVTCSASCGRCCSRPRTWPSSRVTRASVAGSSTTSLVQLTPRLAGVRRRLRPGAAAARPRCSSPPVPRSVARAGAPTCATLDVWDASSPRSVRSSSSPAGALVDALRPHVGRRVRAGRAGQGVASIALPGLAGRRPCG